MTRVPAVNRIRGVVLLPQRLLCESFAHYLEELGFFHKVYAIDKPETVLLLCKSVHPELVLLDPFIKGFDSYDYLGEVRRISPRTRFLIYFSRNAPKLLRQFKEAGAMGMIHNSDHLSTLETAVRAVLNGEEFWPKMPHGWLKKEKEPDVELTDREWQILQYIKESYTSQGIGEKLGLSSRTVEHIRSNLLQRLGIKNAPALIDWLNKVKKP